VVKERTSRGALSLWDEEPVPLRAIERPEANLPTRPKADEQRWRSQTVTAPIEELVRAAAHAGPEGARYADRYDLRRLAHGAIDVVVASMGIANAITDTELVGLMAAAAARMAPEASQAEWQSVAEFVYGHLLNSADEFAKFSYVGIDADGRRRPFEFQLLVPREADSAIAINASPEAINVYLKAFGDLDVTDAEVAMSVMLDRQINDGRFEVAAQTAETAARISRASAAKIGELLEDTKRDVGSVDWRGSMREDLVRAARHVASRVPEDDRLLDHVSAGTESEERAVREASGEIYELLLDCKRLHLGLEDRLVRAHRTFLDAQTEQRLAHRKRMRLLSLNDQLFVPTMKLPVADAGRVTDAFAVAALGTVAPRLPWLSGLIDALLAPGRSVEPTVREAEEPELEDEPEAETYPDETLAAARAIFATATASPRRLSALLDDAREADDSGVLELIWLGSLWAFAPDQPDDPEIDLASSVEEVTAGLVADDDATALHDAEFAGANLLIGTPEALAAMLSPLAPEAAAEPRPVSIDAYRRNG
jgi:hypothetical protein